MTVYSIRFHESVREDILEILDWYFDQKPGLEQEFFTSLESAITRLRQNPLACQIQHRQTRYAHLSRFPYRIVYRVLEREVFVFGVFHVKRSPRLIRKRLK